MGGSTCRIYDGYAQHIGQMDVLFLGPGLLQHSGWSVCIMVFDTRGAIVKVVVRSVMPPIPRSAEIVFTKHFRLAVSYRLRRP